MDDLCTSLSELLERHSKSMPPDYFGFYNGVSAILAAAAPPRTFCEIFATMLKSYNDEMGRYSERGERGEDLTRTELDTFREVFHKYKLLNGCAEKLPLEMGKLIAELAGCPVLGITR